MGMMFSTDLGKGKHCDRENCPPCKIEDKRPNCKTSSILYESKCVECNPTTSSSPDHQQNQPRNGVYYGETSRSLHERALEHTKDAKAFVEGSHMVKHWMERHPFQCGAARLQIYHNWGIQGLPEQTGSRGNENLLL